MQHGGKTDKLFIDCKLFFGFLCTKGGAHTKILLSSSCTKKIHFNVSASCAVENCKWHFNHHNCIFLLFLVLVAFTKETVFVQYLATALWGQLNPLEKLKEKHLFVQLLQNFFPVQNTLFKANKSLGRILKVLEKCELTSLCSEIFFLASSQEGDEKKMLVVFPRQRSQLTMVL